MEDESQRIYFPVQDNQVQRNNQWVTTMHFATISTNKRKSDFQLIVTSLIFKLGSYFLISENKQATLSLSW